MKNVKMMLLSLALFAVVGAALAFKARFVTTFCTGVAVGPDNTGVFCPNKIIRKTFDTNGTTGFVATTTYDGSNCNTPNLKCTTTSTSLKLD
jgi:hypothetical protein